MRLNAGVMPKRLPQPTEPAPFVYLYGQSPWTEPVLLLRVWPFDTTRKAICMKREQFLAQPEVESFVVWLVEHLPQLTFKLNFKSSKFVPGGLKAEVQGFEQVIQHYHWKANWQDSNHRLVDSQTWGETQRSLGQLREWLTSAVNAGNEQHTLQACLQILHWGGVRGAIVFLHGLAAKGELTSYLQAMAGRMSLDGNNDLNDLDASSVERFDAGLTKIHALFDTSGSPIYDSRVGAAIAMLYSLFRQQWTQKGKPLLAFPSGAARGSQLRNPGDFIDCISAPQFGANSCEDWAKWQVRLGWIIRAVLEERPGWFADQGALPARCHAFEASLFMLGYDLRCFGVPEAFKSTPLSASGSVSDDVQDDANDERESISGRGWVPTGHPFTQVLQDYLVFRNSGVADKKNEFVRWLVAKPARPNKKPLTTESAAGYCFPFASGEFDLFQRPMTALEQIVVGGERGLCAARCVEVLDTFTVGDERESVCLVDVYLTGQLYRMEMSADERVAYLIDSGFAGKKHSANTLMNVGRGVGKHFGLLDDTFQPTELFDRFFGTELEL